MLHFWGEVVKFNNEDFQIKNGDRIAQLILKRIKHLQSK